MKKVLLSLLALSSLGAMAQTYIAADSITVGDAVNFYVVDSAAANLDATTGTAVTWDYSTLTGYAGAASNLDTNILAASSAFASDFPGAHYNDIMNGGTSIFYENYPDSVVSHGYVFEVDGNEIIIKHDVDIMKTLEFPMNQGDSFTDIISGTIDVTNLGISGEPQNGSVTVTADGTGSMNIGGVIIPNVIRIKLVETLTATVTIPPLPPQTGDVTRTVYSYYDHTNSVLPVFLHANIDVQATGFGGAFQAVYSTVDVNGVGIEDNTLESPKVFPNPSSDYIQFAAGNQVEKITLTDISGKVVYAGENLGTFTKLDISKFVKGTYVLTTTENGVQSSQKVVFK
ncbi:MAG: hypothetical protein ACI857_001997 [Arenicella sp.]|jgi:hypothetical protein